MNGRRRDVVLNYNIYDVFTETKMAGNPLAVMYDADDLDQGDNAGDRAGK